MCLGIPGKVIHIEGEQGKVSMQGNVLNVSFMLLEKIEVGDFVLVHTGFALEKLEQQEAEQTLALLDELKK
jgi:hydrogenase expression/formation protein HypC